MKIHELLKKHPIIPVVTIDNVEDALPIAKALRAGGIHIIEVTLRTPVALLAIEKISQQFDDMIVGAGTVLESSQLEGVQKAGAQFAVSPGLTDALSQTARELSLPFLPSATTPSEVMHAKALGHQALKFFPAEASGGVPKLKAFCAVFPDIYFCPTGGVNRLNAKDYLALPNVISVGGTWLVTQSEVASQSWEAIQMMSKEALSGLGVAD